MAAQSQSISVKAWIANDPLAAFPSTAHTVIHKGGRTITFGVGGSGNWQMNPTVRRSNVVVSSLGGFFGENLASIPHQVQNFVKTHFPRKAFAVLLGEQGGVSVVNVGLPDGKVVIYSTNNSAEKVSKVPLVRPEPLNGAADATPTGTASSASTCSLGTASGALHSSAALVSPDTGVLYSSLRDLPRHGLRVCGASARCLASHAEGGAAP